MPHTSCLAMLGGIFGIVFAVQAEVALDGTLGTKVTLPGPRYEITADLGQQRGGNLFHSFGQFNLREGEVANFSGPDNVQNIISRITNGKISSIDGTVRSDIPRANLFLINPQGFIWGANATLDIRGSLYLSTASQVQFGETGVFNALTPENSVLVSAPPSAFGFISSKPATIAIKGGRLETTEGNTLSLSAGGIQVSDSGRLSAISGRIDLVAVTYARQLTSNSEGIQTDTSAKLGTIELRNDAILDVGTQGAGNIFIRGGLFTMDNSKIIANTASPKDGGIININVNELQLLNRAKIDSRTLEKGQGGSIFITVAGPATLSQSDIFTTSRSTESLAGKAGNIVLKADYLTLSNSTISTTTYGAGQGGDIHIMVDKDLALTYFPSLFSPSTAIQATSENTEGLAGHAGRIDITAHNLTLKGVSSKIDNSTLGEGQGGNIALEIKDHLQLQDGALISAGSRGTGNAGSIVLNARVLELQEGTISTAADKADGGNIAVNVRYYLDMNNSQISATVSGGQGNGGNVAISNPSYLRLQDSKVIANASGGHGGLILIITGVSIQSEESVIAASSKTGVAGEVKIGIPNVEIVTLPIDFLDASLLIKKRCAAKAEDGQLSSFVVNGRGGLPNAPDDLQSHLPPIED